MAVREWAGAKMLLEQSKVDAGCGGKDWINRFQREDLGQEGWELALGHSEQESEICGSFRIREGHC